MERLRRCWSAARSWSPSPTSPTCSGTENPLAEIARLAHEVGAVVLADGAQAAPKLPLDVGELGVDFYAITGHKLYAPTGIGALWAKLDLLRAMPPFLGGGSMIRKVTTAGTTFADPPARFEAGTPAIAQAIGMASALRWLDGLGMEPVLAHERAIADYALQRLDDFPGLRVFGPPRGPDRVGPVSFELEGVHAHDVSEILDRHGVAGPRRPPLRPAPDGSASRRRHRPAPASASTPLPRRSTA
jgi:cysteine desulfurase/selenocysteine lyase